MVSDIYLTREELENLYELYCSNELEYKREEIPWHEVPKKLGLVCTDRSGCFYNTVLDESFLRVLDEKKWLLLKLKYAI
jgi:hypothetical protein